MKKLLTVILSIVLAASLTACVDEKKVQEAYDAIGNLFNNQNKAEARFLSDLEADGTYFFIEETEEVIFTVKSTTAPTLYTDELKIGEMHDDGMKGDAESGDGIYSIKVAASATEETSVKYYASISFIQSNNVSLFFFDEPSDEEITVFENQQLIIEEIDDEITDESGFIPEEKRQDALKNVYDYVNSLLESGEVVECRMNEENVYIKFSSGLAYVYIPNVEGYADTGDDPRLRILTCEPFRSAFQSVRIDEISEDIIKVFPDCRLYNRIDEDVVTTSTVKNEFKSNMLILWYGHGTYDAVRHSLIVTGEPSINGFLYIGDYLTGRLVSTSSGRIAFGAKFVEKYCGNLNNSVIYLNCCSSAKDSELADAFLAKGARAVVGNTKTIRSEYARLIQEETLGEMLCPNKDSSAYFTLKEALKIAKNEYGINDSSYGGTDGAETIIIGDGTFKLSDKTPESQIDYSAIYKAYLELLQQNKDYISKYIWQNGYYGYGSMTEEQTPRPINISDINGDGVPELIYVAADSQYDESTMLHIYGYRNGEAEELYNGGWDYTVGGGFAYVLFRVSGDPNLFAYYSEGDEWVEDNYDIFESETGNSLELKQLYKYSNHSGNSSDWAVRDIHYYTDDTECDELTYTNGTTEIQSKITEIVMMSEGCNQAIGAENITNSAMTYEEAICYLEGQLGGIPAETLSVSDTDLAISEDCLRALGDSYQNLKNIYGGRLERDTGSTPKMLVETEKNWIFLFTDYVYDLSSLWEECGDDICWWVEGTAGSILGIAEPVSMKDIADSISVSPVFEKTGEASFREEQYSDHGSDPMPAYYITIPATTGYLEIRSIADTDVISPDSWISVRKPDIRDN